MPPFSPCGRWVVIDGKVRHIGTGRELFQPAGERSERLSRGERWSPAPVWFSADSRLLAGRLQRIAADGKRNDDTIAVWELASGKLLARFPGARLVAQVAFSPDSSTIAFVDGWGIHFHDLLTGKQLAAYEAPDIVCTLLIWPAARALVFAPDGRSLATGHQARQRHDLESSASPSSGQEPVDAR